MAGNASEIARLQRDNTNERDAEVKGLKGEYEKEIAVLRGALADVKAECDRDMIGLKARCARDAERELAALRGELESEKLAAIAVIREESEQALDQEIEVGRKRSEHQAEEVEALKETHERVLRELKEARYA